MTNKKSAPVKAEEKTKIDVNELIESINGYEEIAVEKAFGDEPMTLLQLKPIRGLRACLFIVKKREGLNDLKAHQFAMATNLKNLNEMFEYEEEDDDAEEEVISPKESEPESEQD